MADHLQDQIMNSVKATLIAAATAAGMDVVIDGVDPIPVGKSDWISIEAGPEISEPQTIGFPPIRQREFSFTLVLVAVRKTDWRVAASTLLKQSEAALSASTATFSAGGKARGGIHYIGTETPEKDGTGQDVVYRIPARFAARYSCAANTPDTPV